MGSPLRLPVWVISLDSSKRVGQHLNLIFVEVEFWGALDKSEGHPELQTNFKRAAGNHFAAISACAVNLIAEVRDQKRRVTAVSGMSMRNNRLNREAEYRF
jgi:hypothetical protein